MIPHLLVPSLVLLQAVWLVWSFCECCRVAPGHPEPICPNHVISRSAGILGYFFKAKCSKDDDEDELADAAVSVDHDRHFKVLKTDAVVSEQFNKDDFRRESRMLGMDDDAMSMHSASQAGSLSR